MVVLLPSVTEPFSLNSWKVKPVPGMVKELNVSPVNLRDDSRSVLLKVALPLTPTARGREGIHSVWWERGS
jgi:hypothetical protein